MTEPYARRKVANVNLPALVIPPYTDEELEAIRAASHLDAFHAIRRGEKVPGIARLVNRLDEAEARLALIAQLSSQASSLMDFGNVVLEQLKTWGLVE